MSKKELQKFKIEKIKRSEIKIAEYNPRTISERNRNNLKKAIKKHGLVAPLMFNKRTGNLVGGHQRLSVLDELNDSQDYELDVSVIDVDEKEEKAINIALNNKNLQGTFDGELLANLSLDGFDLMKDGFFSEVELKLDFGISFDKPKEKPPEEEKIEQTEEEALEEMMNTVNQAKEKKKAERDQIKSEKDQGIHKTSTINDYTQVLVFSSAKEKIEVMEKIGKRGEKFLYFADLKKIFE